MTNDSNPREKTRQQQQKKTYIWLDIEVTREGL